MRSKLATGGKGLLAKCIKDIAGEVKGFNFIYAAVENAEKYIKITEAINGNGAKNLALICKKTNLCLAQISTDLVFHRKQAEFYNEQDETKPTSVYGDTKLKGELTISNTLEGWFFLRISRLYSEHGNKYLQLC